MQCMEEQNQIQKIRRKGGVGEGGDLARSAGLYVAALRVHWRERRGGAKKNILHLSRSASSL